jgi:predicted amidohydrolase
MQKHDHCFVVCLQPNLTQHDYISKEKFSIAVDETVQRAIQKEPQISKPNSHVMLIFPELIGTWLFITAGNLPRLFFHMHYHLLPMIYFFLRHFLPILWLCIKEYWYLNRTIQTKKSPTLSLVFANSLLTRCLFKYKSKEVLQLYTDVFSSVAKRYNAYVVAGSAFLPRLHFENGAVSHTDDGFYNISLVFDPTGKVCNVEYKQYPIESELDILDLYIPSDGQLLPKPFQAGPFGATAVLICADGWYPSCYQGIKSADIIINPAFNTPGDTWLAPWPGYSGWDTPDDVDTKDIGKKTLEDMWKKYSSPGRGTHYYAQCVVLCQSVANIWDITANGRSVVMNKNNDNEYDQIEAADHLREDVIVVEVPFKH